MISHEFRAIFIHQRKTAGSSMISSFGYKPADPNWRLFNDGTATREWKRKESLARGYLVFTVARNPWDRFISGWKYLAAYKDRPLDEVLSNLPRTGHDYKHLTRPQADILFDEGGRFVPDYVLRYESLAEDYARLCRILGREDSTLPVMNRTEHLGYESYFADSAAIEMVADLFWRDIELFGYQFGVSAMNPGRPDIRAKLLEASAPP